MIDVHITGNILWLKTLVSFHVHAAILDWPLKTFYLKQVTIHPRDSNCMSIFVVH